MALRRTEKTLGGTQTGKTERQSLDGSDIRHAAQAGHLEAEIVGHKVHGLASLPVAWAVEQFFVIPTGVTSLDSEAIRQALGDALARYPSWTEVIVRSSAPDEQMHHRGRYLSKQVESVNLDEVCKAAREILSDFHNRAPKGARCALLVHPFMRCNMHGHLSNERRVARKVRDFLAEVWSDPDSDPDAFALQSKKQVVAASPLETIKVRLETPKYGEVAEALRGVARWIHQNVGRAHLEWIVTNGELRIVQCDKQSEEQTPPAMVAWACNSTVKPNRTTVFELANESNATNLRKTRSVLEFQACGLPTAPLYLLSDQSEILDCELGQPSSGLIADLEVLLAHPITIRVDVVQRDESRWQNLPASGPIRTLQEATTFLQEAVAATRTKIGSLTDVVLVAHHFLPAQAAAWAEHNPASRRTRVDACWGHADGLQSFPCDTFYCDADGTSFIYERYKDEFLDVNSEGKRIAREAGAPWDRRRITDTQLRTVFEGTATIAKHLDRNTRVMWFIGTGGAMGVPDCIPWILEDDKESEDPFIEGRDGAPRELIDESLVQGRRIAVGAIRKIKDEADLSAFEAEPKAFSLGEKRVIFRPSEAFIRERDFVERVGQAALSRGWSIVLEGSALAHSWYLLRQVGVQVESSMSFALDRKRRRIFGKLVRDRIPSMVRAKGEFVQSRQLGGEKRLAALKSKLLEEAYEVFAATTPSEVVAELADVIEVIRAVAEQLGSNLDGVLRKADQKRDKRGGFDSGMFLVSTGGDTQFGGRLPEGCRVITHPGAVVVSIPLVPPAQGAEPPNRGSHQIARGLGVILSLQRRSNSLRLVIEPEPIAQQLEFRWG
jgi:predicted house-cleaning noncanonical NTP pyrophosphatase (MazG superfamily)